MKMNDTPERTIAIQLVHRHPKYWVENPPIKGPKVGPLSGPIAQSEKANALYSSVTISLIDPGAFAIIALPASAAKNRTTMTSANEVARPQGMYKIVKRHMLTMYTGRRPNISEAGASITEPMASPTTGLC